MSEPFGQSRIFNLLINKAQSPFDIMHAFVKGHHIWQKNVTNINKLFHLLQTFMYFLAKKQAIVTQSGLFFGKSPVAKIYVSPLQSWSQAMRQGCDKRLKKDTKQALKDNRSPSLHCMSCWGIIWVTCILKPEAYCLSVKQEIDIDVVHCCFINFMVWGKSFLSYWSLLRLTNKWTQE